MSRIIVMNQVTLDGVMQGLGDSEADTRDGFTHSGWGSRAVDERGGQAISEKMGERMTAGGGLTGWLFGRRTYEELLATWNARGGPYRDALNKTPKYVASRTLTEPLRWPNSTLLHGDIVTAVSALKAESGGVLGIMGSGELIGSLMTAGLIDEYLLMIHPLVLGSGRRLFPDGVELSLRLTDSLATAAGVLLATYESVGSRRD